jgi:hypothetical protein
VNADSTLALKFLGVGAIGPYSGFAWPKPRGSRPGKWVHVDGDLDMCRRGIHACTFAQATRWLREECYVIELRDVVSDDGEKLLARSGRLVRRVDSWDQRAMVRYAADCAAHVLPAFEKKYPKDNRPRKAIQVARKWARSPSEKNAYAAAAAARVAYAAAYDAYAVEAAYAAYAAAYAAYAVEAAYAAYAAAYAADEKRAWQVKRFRHYIKAPEVRT